MAESKAAEKQVEAATDEKVTVPDAGKSQTVTTKVWLPGTTANKEELKKQAVINTRDAVPVAAYDAADFEVISTKHGQLDKTAGVWWECAVTYTPRAAAKVEQVDLEKVIQEAKAGVGVTHPGDPSFLGED